MTSAGQVDIVVLYYRLGPAVRLTLDSVLAQGESVRRVLVVDNASGDGVIDALDPVAYPIERFALPQNLGYAGGMNAGFDALEDPAPFVLFLTHETVLATDCVQLLLETMTVTGAAVGGPFLRRRGDDSPWSAGGFFGPRALVSHHGDVAPDRFRRVSWLDGAALLIRADAFATERFDERYFLYWEDIDICQGLARHGPVVCDQTAIAWQDTNYMPPYFEGRNRVLFFRKWANRRTVAWAVVREVRALQRDLRLGKFRRAWARLRGVQHGLVDGLSLELAKVR